MGLKTAQNRKNAGITSELHVIPGAGHTPTGALTYPEIADWVSRFFANEWQKSLTNR
jgi:hypothetical protein